MALFRCGAGEAFDISTLPVGNAAFCVSSAGTTGYTIRDCVTNAASVTLSATGNVALFMINADGYNTLTVKGASDPNNTVVFGLNADGTLECIYAARITTGNTHTVNTQDYQYLICTVPAPGNSITASVQLSNV